jgi:hypothetical protein
MVLRLLRFVWLELILLIVFILFEEPDGFAGIPQGAVEYGSTLEDRREWGAWNFGELYGLKLVGVNYFLIKGKDI